MKKIIVILVVVMVLVLGTIGTALAITFGELDGDNHPYVGMYYFSDWEGNWRCSGTLVSPTVFLTAGHCTFGAFDARVAFEAEITDASIWHIGTAYAHDGYNPEWTEFPNTYDVGVVVLDEPIYLDEYGSLPPIGYLEGIDVQRVINEQHFGVVGYGLQQVKPETLEDRVRMCAEPFLVNLKSANNGGYNLQLSNNRGIKGTGGTCFGDSGGPTFYPPEANTVVGVTSFGPNGNCEGVSYAYRVDTEVAQAFLCQHIDELDCP